MTEDGKRQTMTLSNVVRGAVALALQTNRQLATARSREEVKTTRRAGRSGPEASNVLRVAEHDGALPSRPWRRFWRVGADCQRRMEVIDRPRSTSSAPGMLPPPVPVQGGSVAELFDPINVPDSDGRACPRAGL